MTFASFVINLATDVPRRQHMQAQLASIGLHAEFIVAVDGRALSSAERAVYDRRKALRVYGNPVMDTEIGCYLSHYRLWQRIVHDNLPAALVMEDDIEISHDLPRIIDDLLANPAPPWLVVRLDSVRGPVREAKAPKFLGVAVQQLHQSQLYRLKTHILGTGAYLIRREGAERLLAYGRRIFMPVDQTMDRYWENGIIPYLVRPMPVRQRLDFPSGIGARPAGRHVGHGAIANVSRRLQRGADSISKRLFNLWHC